MGDADRFFHRVEKTDGCWNWTGATFGGRYGAFWVGGKTIGAHKFSFVHHHGAIPDGMYVCHHCDNPRCVRPDHLFLGTPKDNSQDMVSKGRVRVASGDKHYKTKIREEDLQKIIEMCKTMTQAQVARAFGVDPSHISRIAAGHKRGRKSTHAAPLTYA